MGSEEYLVEVHVHNLFLGKIAFQLDGRDPFLELDDHHLRLADPLVLRTRIQGLGKLLRDRTAATLARTAHQDGLEQHAEQRLQIDTRMGIEANILRRDGGVDQVVRNAVLRNIYAILYMICCQDLPVAGNHLRGQHRRGILQLLIGGDIGK